MSRRGQISPLPIINNPQESGPTTTTPVTEYQFDLFYLICGAIGIFPLLIRTDYGLENTELDRALKSYSVKYVFAGSIALAFPIILDLSLDLLSKLPFKNIVSRIILLISLVVPSFIYLVEFNFSAPTVNYYLVLSCVQRIFRGGAMYSLHRDVSPALFPFLPMSFGLSMLLVSEYLEVEGLYRRDMSLRLASLIMRYIFYALTLLKTNLPVFVFIYRYIRSSQCIMTDEDKFMMSAAVSANANVLTQALLPLAGPGGLFFIEQYNETFLIVYCAMTSAVSFAATVLPTRALTHKAYKLEQELDSRKTFVRQISHEVRTPLNTVSVGLNLMQAKLSRVECDKETVDILDDMKESCESAAEILTDMNDFDNICSDHIALQITYATSVFKFFREVLSPFLRQSLHSSVRVIVVRQQYLALQRGGWLADIDKQKIAQALRNLIKTAVKLSPPGETVTFQAEVLSINVNPTLRIDITDQGPGVSAESLALLLRSSNQSPIGSNLRGESTLLMNKKILDLHGGKLLCSTEPGFGSTFSVEFPVYRTTRNVDDILQHESEVLYPDEEPLQDIPIAYSCRFYSPNQPTRSRGNYKSILIVDDSTPNRKMMVRLLLSKGHHVDEATTGQEAVDHYILATESGEVIDVILMDDQMPVMSGEAATAKLRDIGYTGCIIGVAAHALHEEVQAFLGAGASQVISKPVDIKELEFALQLT